jgi:ABC-2 type transport system ATP-binding protein
VAQEALLYQNLTVGETLRVIASLNRRWDADRARERLDDLGIPLSRRVRRMPGGQQAQLAVQYIKGSWLLALPSSSLPPPSG